VSIERIQDVPGHSSPAGIKTIYVETTRKKPPTGSASCSAL
jgi:hypothetical protein